MSKTASNVILIGIVLAIALAGLSVWLFGEKMTAVRVLGDFFLRSLRMIIVPLVLASVIVGISGLGDVRRLGRVGGRLLLYYTMTTGLAVAAGIVVVNVIRPGEGVSTQTEELPAHIAAKEELGWQDIVLSFVSENIFKSLSEMEMLPIIMFALVFGGVLTTLGDKGKPVLAFFDGLNEAIMKIVHLLMWIAPIGIFGLVAARFGQAVADEKLMETLQSLTWYMVAIFSGLAFHGFVVLPLLCWTLARRNPLQYFSAMFPAILTAWSTASSSATLPLTIECAEERAGVDKKAAGFVLPLGATINMDGTALYESVAAIFIAQAYGIDLSMTDTILIFITATLASIGAAGIPEAGLFTMVIVLTAVKLPLEGVGMLLAVDWFLDRFRTAINVWGDSVGAAYVHRIMQRDHAIPAK